MARLVVVAVGNPLRGDDGIGPDLARAFVSTPDCLIIDAETVPENFLHEIERARPVRVVIVDACDFGGAPGSWQVFDYDAIMTLPGTSFSTHTLPLSFFARLARTMTGATIELVGIQPAVLTLGAGLSDALTAARPALVAFLARELGLTIASPGVV